MIKFNWIKSLYRTVLGMIMIVLGCVAFINCIDAAQYYLIPLALAYTVTINDVFCHRICAHRMFKVNTRGIVYKILTWLSTVELGYGPVRNLTIFHDLHHRYSDNGPLDVMNWRYYWYSSATAIPLPLYNFTGPKDLKKYLEQQRRKHGHIIDDPWTKFCSEYQLSITTVSLILFYFTVPEFLNVLLLGRFLLVIATSLGAICGHIKRFPTSYRNFNTNDTTSNVLVFHYLMLGIFDGVMQNNHHGRPGAIHQNPNWWEVSTLIPVMYLLKFLMEDR